VTHPAEIETPRHPRERTTTNSAGEPGFRANHQARNPDAVQQLTWAYLTLRGQAGSTVDSTALLVLGKQIPTKVRSKPFSTGDEQARTPVPAGVALDARLKLLSDYRPSGFTEAFQAVRKGE
jgi:hypothetical protein